MSYRDWPKSLEGNMFTLAKHEPNVTPTKVEVTTWSGLFSDGGSVTVEAYLPDGKRVQLASIGISTNRSVRNEREYLKGFVDEFNVNPKKNWRALINAARKKVTEYHERQAAEHAEKLEKARAGVFA
jgi:hypothetical protein